MAEITDEFGPEDEVAEAALLEADEEIIDVQSTVKVMIEDAVRHYEEELEPDQVQATDYYWGREFGNEKEGRSKVVSTDVRDATLTQLPSIMRVLFGPERVVEYRPRGPEDEEAARQATEYVNYIVAEENEGFQNLLAFVQDGLVRRLGVMKWWWEEEYRTTATRFTGLSEEQLVMLMQDPEVGPEGVQIDAVSEQVVANPMNPMGGSQLMQVYDVTVTRVEQDGCARVEAVPPEEFVYTPNARSLDKAALVAHVREVPADELIAMGLDEDLVMENAGKDRYSQDDDMESTRQYHEGGRRWDNREDARDPAQRPVVYAEAYAMVDGDGDGITERRLFQCVGPDYEIANGDGLGEIVDEVPFAVWSPYPEAHTVIGQSNWDLLKDVQLVKSQMLRGTLDSLSESISPTTEVVAGEVNMQDFLNPEASRVVRVRRPGMIREVTHRFVGGDTLPVLQYYDEIKENRTGTSKAAAGLDADALQSATKAAVAATLTGSQQRIEMVVRVLAETGMKQLFRGLLKLVVKHQNRAKVIKLRNRYVEIDPRAWDATMDVQVNVALGQGAPEDKVQALMGILSAQKELLMAGNPLVSNVEIRNTLGRLVELTGWRHSEEFFKPWGPAEEQQLQQQMAQQPPPPDPTAALVDIERMKAMSDSQIEQAKLQIEQWKATMDDDRERDKIARESALKEYELELKYKAQIEDSVLKAKVQQDRAAMDADVKMRAAARSTPAGGE